MRIKDLFVIVLLASMLAGALFLGIVKPYLDRTMIELENDITQSENVSTEPLRTSE